MAVGPACVGLGVGVTVSSVASFASRDDAVTTAGFGTVAVATAAVGIGCVVAGFKAFHDAVAADGKHRVGAIKWARLEAAFIQWVTVFRGVGDTITTVGKFTIRAAGTRGCSGCVVA